MLKRRWSMMENKSTSVKREIVINQPPEKIWKALTVPAERNRWETENCEMDRRVGGEAYFDYGWGSTYRCKIVEFKEYKKLVLQGDEKQLTIWTLEKLAKGTKVTIEYTGLWISDIGHMEMDNMAFGTMQFMRNLKSVLEQEDDIRSRFWKSWIGIGHTTVQTILPNGTKVVRVHKGTPGFGVLQEGDIITHANGTEIQAHDDLELLVTETVPETEIHLDVCRKDINLRVSVKTVPFGSIEVTS
jgi:uncharacterized protein YndB with AHSA1/START domain